MCSKHRIQTRSTNQLATPPTASTCRQYLEICAKHGTEEADLKSAMTSSTACAPAALMQSVLNLTYVQLYTTPLFDNWLIWS
jgi:hypothetical protein